MNDDEIGARLRRILATGPLTDADWKIIEFWNWLAAKAAEESADGKTPESTA